MSRDVKILKNCTIPKEIRDFRLPPTCFCQCLHLCEQIVNKCYNSKKMHIAKGRQRLHNGCKKVNHASHDEQLTKVRASTP